MKPKLDFNKIGKRLMVAAAVGASAGIASAVFLHSLDFTTRFREANSWILFGLPMAGFLVAWIYDRFGSAALHRGNNLLIDEIHQPENMIPLRMTPLILLTTLITHLFGGSAGREGTAVQMGGSIADQFVKPFNLEAHERKRILMMGMSAGFGSVFGVPLAGAVFGMEVLTIGRLDTSAWLECLVASLIGHWICLSFLVRHTEYPAPELVALGAYSVIGVAVAGLAFGICARAFVFLIHRLDSILKRGLPNPSLRAFTGGVLVVVGFYILGTMRFAGLGVPVIVESLRAPLPPFDFAWKTFFTSLTLASGFKGGEVTPLLFIGATLGNSLSEWIALPFSLLAAVGFVAVFAGAANTPWACTVMAMEIFGWRVGIFALIACWASFFISSRRGIYPAQRPGRRKIGNLLVQFWRRPEQSPQDPEKGTREPE